jgi:hypothetical protein
MLQNAPMYEGHRGKHHGADPERLSRFGRVRRWSGSDRAERKYGLPSELVDIDAA